MFTLNLIAFGVLACASGGLAAIAATDLPAAPAKPRDPVRPKTRPDVGRADVLPFAAAHRDSAIERDAA